MKELKKFVAQYLGSEVSEEKSSLLVVKTNLFVINIGWANALMKQFNQYRVVMVSNEGGVLRYSVCCEDKNLPRKLVKRFGGIASDQGGNFWFFQGASLLESDVMDFIVDYLSE